MEENNEILREQPEDSLTLEAEEQQINNETTKGSLIDKFKTVEALQSAYKNLEKEFTQKCQKIKELSEKLKCSDNAVQVPEYQKEDWEEKVKLFFNSNPEAKEYVAEISKVLESDKVIASSENSLQNALTKVLANKFVPYSSLVRDEKFLNEYVYSNEEIKDKIISNYLDKISNQKTLPLISGINGSGTYASPVSKPKSIKDAGKLAEVYFKN